ncbi:SGNH/GDSL hydrolase family protein [Janibacter limosus]|uniref:SGNH/GDSL hydrolase family protein n=1 Tax=Janibacter limosus TaxID=53458 RepID=A0AC61U7I1_9MICO|nr:SGNH/GDSL hydrolase family protein [Janibacter limosus]UUZ45999.1 SGNH/GDSL hydrolase family protein [Janibacter limosus]
MALRYVAIGDSLSEGVGDDPWPDGTPRGWADRLAELLAAHHGEVDYANLAVRGMRSRQVLDTRVEAAPALEPDVLTFTAGMNDLLRPRLDVAALRETLVQVVAPFTAKGVRVTVVPIPDIRAVSPAGRLIARRRLVLNGIYQHRPTSTACCHRRRPLGRSSRTRAWADDRLHLSPLGHERLALGSAAALGVPVAQGWEAVPAGAAPRRSVRTEVDWTRRHVGPWLGRRLTGRSSGDGRVAKRPTLSPFETVAERPPQGAG